MTDPGCIVLTRLGEPAGQGRPRFAKATGHAHTPPKTASIATEWKSMWVAAGRPRFPDGAPLHLEVTVEAHRPQGHFKKDGTLSAEGHRSARPTKRPDLSNVVKLIEDALNGLAYRDDAQITLVTARRRWCVPGMTPQTVVHIRHDNGTDTGAQE